MSSEQRRVYVDYFRKMADKFRVYRAGGALRNADPDGYKNLVLPVPNPDETFRRPAGVEQDLWLYEKPDSRRFDRVDAGAVEVDKMTDHKARAAMQAYQALSESFDYDVTYRLGPCLGLGGQGFVVRYDQVNSETGEVGRSIAVKRAFDSRAQLSLKRERELMTIFLGAAHMVQPIFRTPPSQLSPNPAGDPRAGPPGTGPSAEAAEDGQSRSEATRGIPEPDDGLLAIEFLRNGDLALMVQRMHDLKLTMPDQIAWRLLRCLAQACVEMDSLPAANRKGPYVHFDLDPTNILVDDFTAAPGELDVTPALKVSDFGLGRFIELSDKDQFPARSQYRGLSKHAFFAPEQFTAEWDVYGPFGAGDFDSKVRAGGRHCPGNYGSHTNVWGMGVIMEVLLTHNWPGYPPLAFDLHSGGDEAGAERRPPLMTYGLALTRPQYGKIDLVLRQTICRCQAHYPDQRPSPSTLLQICNDNVGGTSEPGAADREGNDELRRWMQRILQDAPSLPS